MIEHSEATLLAQARAEGGCFILPERVLLRVTGSDRLRYLNGQVTNDLRKLTPGMAMQACLLTAKGKLSAVVQISLEEDAFLIEADPSLEAVLLERLERYIIADEVAIEPLSPSEQKVHIFGPLSASPEFSTVESIAISRMGTLGKDLLLSAISKDFLQKYQISPYLQECLRIERGLPCWGKELTSEVLPPEALLEKSSIDYEKGCYLGQEIISRLKSVGQVNRLLTQFKGTSGALLATGMELFSSQEESRSLGFLTSVVQRPGDDFFIALGYLRRGSTAPKENLLARSPNSEGTSMVSVQVF